MIWVFDTIRDLVDGGDFSNNDFTTRNLGGKPSTIGDLRLFTFKFEFMQWVLKEWLEKQDLLSDAKDISFNMYGMHTRTHPHTSHSIMINLYDIFLKDMLRGLATHGDFRKKCGSQRVPVDISWQSRFSNATRLLISLLEDILISCWLWFYFA